MPLVNSRLHSLAPQAKRENQPLTGIEGVHLIRYDLSFMTVVAMPHLPAALSALSQIDMLPGQRMEFLLSEPATAGYLWEVVRAEGVEAKLERVPLDVDPALPTVVGRSGQVRLILVAPEQIGEGHVAIALARPWLKEDKAESLELAIIVSDISVDLSSSSRQVYAPRP